MNFKIGNVEVGLDSPLFVMAGPCVIESKIVCLDIARRLVDIGHKLNIGIIFKASFDKANRTSISSYRGCGTRANGAACYDRCS
jgi:2-dehydro-3-deoxyphosphooctonate aldolase (KDO 8-P synthase)